MRLEHLHLEQFRRVASATMELPPGATLFLGENGQGKTTILEAVHYLAIGRSIRTSRDRECLPHRRTTAQAAERPTAITGRYDGRGGRHELRAVLGADGKSFFRDGKPLRKLGDLLGGLQVVALIPGDLEIVRGGPKERRGLLDALLARTNPHNLTTMQNYNAALKHRNALLRLTGAGAAAQLDAYEEQLARYGWELIVAREGVTRVMAEHATAALTLLSGAVDEFVLRHEPGWLPADGVAKLLAEGAVPAAGEERLRDLWNRARRADQETGYTRYGPHRGDLALVLNGTDARQFASQGQARTIVLALRFAEVDVIETATGEPPILLLDDVFGELDIKRARQCVRLVARRGVQALITATDATPIEAELPIAARFVVHEGGVRRGGGTAI